MQRPPRGHLRTVTVATAFALVAAACGDGGEQQGASGAGGDRAAPTPEHERFCTVVVEAESTVVREGPEAEVEPLLDEVEETAPEEIREDVATVVAGVRAAAEDPSESQRREFGEADEAIDRFVLENCGYETVDVSGIEYAFEGVRETLPAGRVGFRFTNEGKELHEMVVFRITEGVDATFDEILQQPQDQAEGQVTFVGAGFASPGESDAEVLELEPGRYGMACFVPMGTTDPDQGGDGPPHFTEGMVAAFMVE